MNNNLNELYNDEFYKSNIAGMSESAKIVLKFLFNIIRPNSVIDVGCGKGAWLAVAESYGAKKLKGLDGSWIDKKTLLGEAIDFTAVNFEKDLPELDSKYDLCISLEVAEHISKNNAERFIEYLCSASDCVLFGAAIKKQGGTNHINEQPQTYWIEIFKSNGYDCFDIIRPNIWDNKAVEWWYRQNTFLFIKKDIKQNINIKKLKSLHDQTIYDIVHPDTFEEKLAQKEYLITKQQEKIDSLLEEINLAESKMNMILQAIRKTMFTSAVKNPLKKYKSYKQMLQTYFTVKR